MPQSSRHNGHTAPGPLTGVLFACALALVACDDETIIVQPPDKTNEPPQIVSQGPEISALPLNLRAFDPGPELSVVVADPDGADDIVAVYLNYDSLLVNRLIARRSLQEEGCRSPVYADLDTLALDAVLPRSLPGVALWPLHAEAAGLYVSPPFCTQSWSFLAPSDQCELFPHFENGSPDYGFPGCIDGTEWLWSFVLYPPTVESQTTVFITEADVEYAGLSVIAFDTGGLSDTASFPNLRIVHTTETERRVAP